MRKFVVIGTLHAGITPESELLDCMAEFRPDQVLVEMAQEDIESGKMSDYPPEMVSAYNWARKRGLKTGGFDSKMDTNKEGVTKGYIQKLIPEYKKAMDGLTWREMNRAVNLKRFDSLDDKIVDMDKEAAREKEMIGNIIRASIKDGNVMVITGCAHLKFFKKHLEGAQFPYS